MNQKSVIEKILPLVKKPISYQGNEFGAVHKELTPDMIRFAFAFPDLYEVGMSHLGLKILYALLNEQKNIACERVFAPWTDMEALMREKNVPLFALESADPIVDFDFVGFTLQYEMSYSNILNMLSLAGIPLRAEQRNKCHPLIIAGGPCACNPEPLADFIDLFVIGEGEEVILELMQVYEEYRDDRQAFLTAASKLEGIYVPTLFEAEYDEDGNFTGLFDKETHHPVKIKKRLIADLENVYFPEKVIVPYTETVHDRVMTEIFRGCGRGCRFCQAGMLYRPVREKSMACIEKDIALQLKNTGYDEVALSSLSSGDYSKISELIHELVEKYDQEAISISLPSLRIDSVSIDMLKEIQKVRKTGITLAPEAGTQRMRDVINKGVTEENLRDTVRAAFENGWGHIKLYFMMGLPTETDEDINGIAQLAKMVVDEYLAVDQSMRNKNCKVVVSTSCFVPKPHTPFQWVGQDTKEAFIQKQNLLKGAMTDRHIQYNWHDAQTSYYEAVFARGDRRLSKVLLRAHELGCKFDGWNDYFDDVKWHQAFEDCGINGDDYALRTRTTDEPLPWDHIDIGVTKKFLQKEYQKAMESALTVECRTGCAGCGIKAFGAKEEKRKGWCCDGHDDSF